VDAEVSEGVLEVHEVAAAVEGHAAEAVGAVEDAAVARKTRKNGSL
jgi:hypothetical protein